MAGIALATAATGATAGITAATAAGGVGSAAAGVGGAGGIGKVLGKAGGFLKKNASPIMGAYNLIKGMRDKKKRDALTPSSENYMERQMLNSIRRKRRALETGTAGPGLTLARQMGATAGRQAFKAGGRANLNQIAMMQSQAFQNMAGQNDQQANKLMAQEQNQVNRMAGVSRDIDLLRRAELSADAANEQKDGTSGVMTLGES